MPKPKRKQAYPSSLKREVSALRKIGSFRRPERVVVHLGNIDDTPKKENYSKSFPEVQFVGIDAKKPAFKNRLPNNWRQITASFNSGLKKLRDNSVDLISSEIALGYYGKKFNGVTETFQTDFKKHTRDSIKTAHKKLKPGGKLMIVADNYVVLLILESLRKAGFENKNVSYYELSEKELARTKWMAMFIKKRKDDCVQIIAVK
ncbi:MAG: hypothetical protein ABH986_04535 [archaeon]